MKINIITLIIILLSTIRTSIAQLEIYMADPEVRIAQKIYCQISNIENNDKLQATLDGQLIFEKVGNLQSEEIFMADYRNQKAGKHSLLVKILDQNNNEKASLIRTWTTLHNGIPEVGIDENNSLRMKGELFFPIYAMLEDGDFEYFIENGYMNCGANEGWNPQGYSILTYREWLDLCNINDCKNIGPGTRWEGLGMRTGRDCDTTNMKTYINDLKNHPAQLIWQWADEPDGAGSEYCAFPDAIRRWTDICHRNDTNHPHAVNLVAYDWSWDERYYLNHCGDYSYLYGSDWHNGQKKLIADIIGFDYYPIEFATVERFPGPINFANLAKALDRIKEWNYNLCPIFSWIENCDLSYCEYTRSQPYPNFTPDSSPDNRCTPGVDCPASGRDSTFRHNSYIWTPAPTPEQLWSEYWIKVIHGVKGFKIHPYFAPDGHAQPPRNSETMAKFMNWINDLKYLVLGPESKRTVIDNADEPGNRIDLMVRENDTYIYVFAARLTEVKENDDPLITVIINIEGIHAAQAQVYEEQRTINVTNGKFEDTFAPWDVHIYKIPLNKQTSVELLRFEGHFFEGIVELNWKITSNHNINGFEVQRSQNSSVNFKKIGFVKIEPSTEKTTEYRFIDNDVTGGIQYYRLKQIDIDGNFQLLGNIQISTDKLQDFHLNQNYPNPFNASTIISYILPKNCHVKLTIYDINSKEVFELVDEFQKSGFYNLAWNANNLPSGQYFYYLKAGDFDETKRMLLVK